MKKSLSLIAAAVAVFAAGIVGSGCNSGGGGSQGAVSSDQIRQRQSDYQKSVQKGGSTPPGGAPSAPGGSPPGPGGASGK